MMQNNPASLRNQTCPRCGSSDLVTREREFSNGTHHIELRCIGGHYIKFLPQSEAAHYAAAPEITPQPALKLAPTPAREVERTTPSPTLEDRVSRLETEIEKINRQLLFHVRILGRGPRQASDSFTREITDEQIADFSRSVGGEG